MEVAVERRPQAASRSAAVSFPFSTNFARLFSIVARARSSIGCATSTRRTLKPAWANTWAMPLPIVPAPITPTVLICGIALSRSHDGHEGTRGGFVQHVLRGHRELRV